MKVDVLNKQGEKTGRQVELPDSIFGVEPNEHSMYLAVKLYNANQRQGTHKTKGRSEIKGSTRKLHKQKGTGGSRKGDIKNPLFRGGGTVFGPQPRSYGFSLNKKVKRLAKLSALSVKASGGDIMVIEDVKMDMPKTKEFYSLLHGLKLENTKSTIVMAESDNNLLLSARNIKKAKIAKYSELNTYGILNSGKIVFSESGLQRLVEELN